MRESIRSHSRKIKLFTGPGTRRWPRFNISDVPLIKKIRSNAGSRLRVANISRGGALLWTKGRLERGTRINLRIITSDYTISLSSIVRRSLALAPKGIPRYQAAVAFDRPLQIFGCDSGPMVDAKPAVSINASSADSFPPESNASFSSPSQKEDLLMIAAFLALNLCTERYLSMREELKLNNW